MTTNERDFEITTINDDATGGRDREPGYIIRPWVGPYYLHVGLSPAAAATLLARMDACGRVQSEGLLRLEFEPAG